MITYTKERLLVKATPFPETLKIGVGGSAFSVEIQNTGSLPLASATLKVQYHPKGDWWDSSLTGGLLISSEGSAIATLASGAKAVAVLNTKGIFALQFTFLCSGNWNTSFPNDQTTLNIFGCHS